MDGELRNMAGVYIINKDEMLLLFRIDSRVVGPCRCNIGGHMEKEELNDTTELLFLCESKNQEIQLTECNEGIKMGEN